MELLPQRPPRPSLWLYAGALLLTSAAEGQPWSGARKTADGPSESRARGSITRIHFEPSVETGGFVARGGAYGLSLQADGSTVVVSAALIHRSGSGAPPARSPEGLRFRLVGAASGAPGSGIGVLPGRSHYFIGDDPSAWRRDVPHFESVLYRQVYPGVDLVYYGRGAEVEHDFLVQPGADPAMIRLRIEGALATRLVRSGDLVAAVPGGAVRYRAPVAYQEAGGQRRAVEATYALRERGEIGIRVAAYDRSRPLVIDPVLSYSSYLGGSAQDDGQSVVVAPDKTLWVVGNTQSANMPGAVNAPGGGQDVFVSHLTSDGGTLLSTTYVGGSNVDYGNRLVVAPTGEVYVVAFTISPNFPGVPGGCTFCRQAPAGLLDYQIWDPTVDVQAVLMKLTATGALEYSAVYGGSRREHAWVLGQDAGGGLHSGGDSTSDDFPVSVGAYQMVRVPAALPADPENETDVTVTRFVDSGTGFSISHSTYLGGSAADYVAGLAVDAAGHAHVTGGTSSDSFPHTQNAVQPARAGDSDAFLTRLSTNGSALDYSTFLGGLAYDYPFDVALDADGNAYLAGETDSANFPTTPTAFQRDPAGGRDAFVTKLPGNGGALAFSTRLAGGGTDRPFAIALDPAGNVYVTGRTASTNFPTQRAVQATNAGGDDVFVTKLASDGASLRWSTYVGGGAFDQGHGLAIDGARGVWVVGNAAAGFPTAGTPVQVNFGGVADAFLTRFDESGDPTPLHTVTPCRVVDTRATEAPALAAGTDRTFVIAGRCGIPTWARSVSVNLTVTGGTAAGDLRIAPAGTPIPVVSAINYGPGQTRANNGIFPLGTGGALTVRCAQATGTVQFLLDVNAFFE